MLCARKLRHVRVWARDRDKAVAFAQVEGAKHGVTIDVSGTPREAVTGADIVCTVTKAREPIVFGEWIAPGTHLNVVGSSIASTAEIDTPTVVKSRFFVDYRSSTITEGGEYLRALRTGAITPEHILAEIGEVANGSKTGRTSTDDVTLYKSLGIAPQDLASAHYVLQRPGSVAWDRLSTSNVTLGHWCGSPSFRQYVPQHARNTIQKEDEQT